jgi:hypothetical protein
MERGKTGQGNTGTPAANAASRKTGNTPGSQRGGRVNEKPGRWGDQRGVPFGPEITVSRRPQERDVVVIAG